MSDRQNRGILYWDPRKTYTKPEYIIVFDLDGVLAEYQYVKPEDRGPEIAPAIYSAMKPTFLINWPRALKDGVDGQGSTGLEIVYLTARKADILKEATVEWLKGLNLEGTVLFSESLQHKIDIIEDYIPREFGVHPSNILVFDDRYKELLKSQVVWRTHNRYPNWKSSKIVKRGDPEYSHCVWQEYPQLVHRILTRYENLYYVYDEYRWRERENYIRLPQFPSAKLRRRGPTQGIIEGGRTIRGPLFDNIPIAYDPMPNNAILRNG